jgi:hypothetical protein
MSLEEYEKRCWLIDLVANCNRRDPHPECACVGIRKLMLLERISAVERMSDHDVDTVLSRHCRCFTRRVVNVAGPRCQQQVCC